MINFIRGFFFLSRSIYGKPVTALGVTNADVFLVK